MGGAATATPGGASSLLGDIGEATIGDTSRLLGGRPRFLFSIGDPLSQSEFTLKERFGLPGVGTITEVVTKSIAAAGGAVPRSGEESAGGTSIGTLVGDRSALVLGGLPLFRFGGGLPVSEVSSDKRSWEGL